MSQLSLKNPAWRRLVSDSAREYSSKGVLGKYIEYNGFSQEVLNFINKEIVYEKGNS